MIIHSSNPKYMEFESPCCGVGRCQNLANADLILKPETNVIVYKWGYYWDQHAIIQSWAAKWVENNA